MFNKKIEEIKLAHKIELVDLECTIERKQSRIKCLEEQLEFLENHKIRHLINYKDMRDELFKIYKLIANVISGKASLELLAKAQQKKETP